MRKTADELLPELYNLLLNPGTREWERTRLRIAKEALETGRRQSAVLDALEADLRPLALRNNLTPDVADFYQFLTEKEKVTKETGMKDFSESNATRTSQEEAIFAGGCFWCMVEPFETQPGILSVVSGYTGGEMTYPTYDQVLSGGSGHVEAVKISYDPKRWTYDQLVTLYWQLTDPTDALGQFQDRGSYYRPIIFYQNPQQQSVAEASKKALEESGKYKAPIVTEILPAKTFWPAENYHQQFYQKHPKRYKKMLRTRHQLRTYQKIEDRLRLNKKENDQ